MPGYSDTELVAVVHAVAQGPNRLRNVAVLWTELHGFSAKEVRLLLRRNVVMPKYEERGEFIIEAELGTKRGWNGVRRSRWSRSRWNRWQHKKTRGGLASDLFGPDKGIAGYVELERPG